MTPWTSAHQASLSVTNSQSMLQLMSIKSLMPSNHLIRPPLWHRPIIPLELHIFIVIFTHSPSIILCDFTPHISPKYLKSQFSSVQFSSVTQSCLTLCDPMNCSTPGLHSYNLSLVMRSFKIYSLSNFQIYNIVLWTFFTMMYIISWELIYFITGSLDLLTTFTYFFHLPS